MVFFIGRGFFEHGRSKKAEIADLLDKLSASKDVLSSSEAKERIKILHKHL
jgi:hypothetical protein